MGHLSLMVHTRGVDSGSDRVVFLFVCCLVVAPFTVVCCLHLECCTLCSAFNDVDDSVTQL